MGIRLCICRHPQRYRPGLEGLTVCTSVSPQDVKYQFTGQVSYDLPVGKGKAVNLNGVSNAIVGGWTVNSIVYLSTAFPINSPKSERAHHFLLSVPIWVATRQRALPTR